MKVIPLKKPKKTYEDALAESLGKSLTELDKRSIALYDGLKCMLNDYITCDSIEEFNQVIKIQAKLLAQTVQETHEKEIGGGFSIEAVLEYTRTSFENMQEE